MIRSFVQDDRGNVAVFAGLTLSLLGVGVGTAIDFSDGSRVRAKLQAGADAAALAGARELLSNSGSTGQSAAKSSAERYLASNLQESEKEIAVAPDSVTVTLRTSKRNLFGGLVAQAAMPVSVLAKAVVDQAPAPCMLALGANEPVGIEVIGSASITAPKCTVESNSTSAQSIRTQGAGTIRGHKVCAAGGTGSAKSTPPPNSCAPGADPNKDRDLLKESTGVSTKPTTVKTVTTSTYTGVCNFTGMVIDNSKHKDDVVLTPGVYCGGLKVQAVNVTFAPGLYVIQDGPLELQAKSTIDGDGVSILLSGQNAVLDLQGSPSMTLKAMQTGPLAGIAIASDTPAVPILTSQMQGSPDITVTGSIYLPNQRLHMQGSPNLKMEGSKDTLIALSFRLQGNPDISIKTDSLNMKTPSLVRLMK